MWSITEFFGMEKEFVFFTVFMVQRDKTIFTENENKQTFRQALFLPLEALWKNKRVSP